MIQEVAKINNGDRDKLIHICLIRGGKYLEPEKIQRFIKNLFLQATWINF